MRPVPLQPVRIFRIYAVYIHFFYIFNTLRLISRVNEGFNLLIIQFSYETAENEAFSIFTE